MTQRTLASALVVASLLLAGCLGASEEPVQQNTAVNNSSTTTPGEMPQGRDGEFAAFKETNATEEGKGGLDHHHDYWAGQTRIDIFKDTYEMDPFPGVGSVAEFTMPQGALVYEATGSVEFLVSNPRTHACFFYGTVGGENVCTDHNAYDVTVPAEVPYPGNPVLKLEYMHAAATEWIPVGDLTWGTPLVIPITSPIETDMPHSTSSLWKFRVVTEEPLGWTLYFDAAATIVKGADGIPLWPGHPDFYANGHFREIFEGRVTHKDYGQYGYVANGDVTPVRPERLISYGTRTLYVYVNITDYKPVAEATAPTNWYLAFNNASGAENITDIYDPNNAVGTATSFVFVVPVDDAGMDTPYGTQSRWQFMLRGALRNCYSNCAAYDVTYDMHIVATDLIADKYTCGGVGGTVCPEGAAEQ